MRTLCWVVCVLAFVSTSSPSGASSGAQDPQTSPVRKDAPDPATTPPARPVTIAADGALTLIAMRLTLQSVLNDISIQAKLPIILAESLENEPVSLELRAVPLEEGLRRLLARYDAFYLFSPSEKSIPSIKGVWVYPKGEGLELKPVPPTAWASTKELETQLENPDPGVRIDTYQALIERHGEGALPVIRRGLADTDDGVRLGTLSAAIDADVEIPSAELHALVLNDSLQSIRLLALEAVESRQEAKAIAESVLNDQDEVIGNHARLLLERLQARAARKPPR